MVNKLKKNKGITLLALVVTIVVLLILAGVSIKLVIGDSGIITKAKEAKLISELSSYKEEFELFINGCMLEDLEFIPTTLNAGEIKLSYNTQGTDKSGNIYTIIPELKNSKYSGKMEIIKGELLLNTKDRTEIKIAKQLGIRANPYDIVDGVLLSSNGNLLLVDETGSLTIPDTVTEIGAGAFAELGDDPTLPTLKTIIIPGTVKKIGNNAFSGNKSIEKVIIENGVQSIGSSAFSSCTNLKEINMPDSVKGIGTECFHNCSKLNKVRLSENIKTIEYGTFHTCSSLQQIKLPSNLNTIGGLSFYASGIENIEIPSNVNYIIDTAFSLCGKLTNINVDKNTNFVFENGILMPKPKDTILFISDAKLKSSNVLEIPEGVRKFTNYINTYSNINTLVLPNSLTSILVEGLPNTISNIKIKPDNPNFMIYNNGLYSKDGKNLIACYNKESVINNLYTNVEVLRESSFKLVTSAKSVELPDAVKTIEDRAFNSSNISKISIGKNANSIGSLLRGWRPRDIELVIDQLNTNYYVEGDCLYKKGDKKELVTILKMKQGKFAVDGSTKIIGENAFTNQKLSEIVLEEGIEKIEYASFSHTTGLKQITMPSSIINIASNAFYNSTVQNIIIDKAKDSIPGAPWGANKGMKVVEWLK